MAKHSRTHPGVQAYLPKGVLSYCVRFKQDGIEKRKGLDTSDAKEAEQLCIQIYECLQGRTPADLDPLVSRILGIKSEDEIRHDRAHAALEQAQVKPALNPTSLKIIRDTVTIEKLERTIREKDKQIADLQKELAGYKGLLLAQGKANMKKIKPKTLKQACADYLADFNKKSATKTEYKSIFSMLEKGIGSDVMLGDLEPERITEYLASRKASKINLKSIKKHASIIKAMLNKQAGGYYPLAPITEWVDDNCSTVRGSKDEADNIYRLDRADVKNLIDSMKDTYWKDVATVQFWLGLRPTEIIKLCKVDQFNNSLIDWDKKEIRLKAVRDEKGNIVKALKTDKSVRTIGLSAEALDVLKRRVAGNSVLIFPVPEDGRFVKAGKSEFEVKNRMWTEDGFCGKYLDTLQDAAKAFNESNTDAKKFNTDMLDTRTLRRSRGKDIQASQGSEKAADFLGNRKDVLKEHYAGRDSVNPD